MEQWLKTMENLTQVLELDLKLLQMEEQVGLMDGISVEDWKC